MICDVGLCSVVVGFVVGRLLQAVVVVVGILSLVAVVGRWDGFNDSWVWLIGVASVEVVRSGAVFGGWVSDSVGFYMDFMSTTAGELADEAERRQGRPERERKKEKEKIFF